MKRNGFRSLGFLIPAGLMIITVCIGAAKYHPLVHLKKLEPIVVKEAAAAEPDSETSSDKDEKTLKKEKDKKFGYPDGIYTGSAKGYGGKISVKVVVKDGRLKSVEITEAEHEDEQFLRRAEGVIDLMIQQQSLKVDAVSGATYSSKGIIQAVYNALNHIEYKEDDADGAKSKTGASSGSPSSSSYTEPANGYKDGVYYGTGTGYGGAIQVKVTISGGAIADIEIVSAPGEDEQYLASARGVIDLILSAQSPQVDVVSGATYSSNGIIEAVKNALSQAQNTGNSGTDPNNGQADPQTQNPGNPQKDDDDREVPSIDISGNEYKDGTYTGSGDGYGGKRSVTVKVTISGGKIKNIELVSSSDTKSYMEKAEAIIKSILSAQSTNVDVVSGATYSSNGIKEAVNAALKKALKKSDGSQDPDDGKNPDGEDPDDNPGDEEPKTETLKASILCMPDASAQFESYLLSLEMKVQDGQILSVENISGKNVTQEEENHIKMAANGTYEYKGVVSQILERQSMDGIDTVSGATCTSKSILKACRKAMGLPDEEEPGTGTVVLVGSALCSPDEKNEFEPYNLSLKVTVTDNKVVSIDDVLGDYTDNSNAIYLRMAAQGMGSSPGVLEQILTDQNADDIDVISGATCSSRAIAEAFRNAMASQQQGEEADFGQKGTLTDD